MTLPTSNTERQEAKLVRKINIFTWHSPLPALSLINVVSLIYLLENRRKKKVDIL